MMNFDQYLNYIAESNKAVKNKSEATGIPYYILKQVYDKGLAAWKTGHRPGTTPQQWALARVNSFIVGGKTTKKADASLWKKAKEALAKKKKNKSKKKKSKK